MSATANTLISIFRAAQAAGTAVINATGSFEFTDSEAFKRWYLVGERLRAVDSDEYTRTLKMLRTYYK